MSKEKVKKGVVQLASNVHQKTCTLHELEDASHVVGNSLFSRITFVLLVVLPSIISASTMFKIHRAIARALTVSTVKAAPRTRVTPAFAKFPSRTFIQCRPRWSDAPSSQEQAATSESTDTVSSESPAAEESALPADQEVAAVSETTDQVDQESAAAASVKVKPSSRSGAAQEYPVYVGNLLFDTTSEDIEEYFGTFGKVARVNLVKDDRGRSKGYAFVSFSEGSGAFHAIKDGNQKEFQGRRLTIQATQNNGERSRDFSGLRRKDDLPPSKTLFVGNMSYQMSDRDLNDLFRDIKGILDVRVAISRTTGQPRGFAHADFQDVDSAAAALKILSGKNIYGRELRVNFSVSPSTTR